MAKLPAKYALGWADANAIYRTARKEYRCIGNGGPHEHAEACPRTIAPGEAYIEFVDTTPLYQRGPAVSIPCALAFGYIADADANPAKTAG